MGEVGRNKKNILKRKKGIKETLFIIFLFETIFYQYKITLERHQCNGNFDRLIIPKVYKR